MQRKLSGLLWPLVVLSATASVWLIVRDRPAEEPGSGSRPAVRRDVERQERKRFYRQKVQPLLTQTREANRRAVRELMDRIDAIFANYRRGITPFTEDVTSIGTRLGVLSRMPGDWWYEDRDVRGYIRGKFEKHIFSRHELRRDLAAALRAYREQLVANRNRLFSGVQVAAQTSDVKIPDMPSLAAYEQQVRGLIVRSSSEAARDSVYNGIATLVVSEAGALLLEQIAVRALASAGTGAAVSAAASGGATTGGAAAGGSAGSLAGPAGTAIGVGVGLVVGVAIDWWMTERFKDRLQKKLEGYLGRLKKDLVYGTSEHRGLKQVAEEFSGVLYSAEKQALRGSILGTQSS